MEINSKVIITEILNRTEEEQEQLQSELDRNHFGYVYCTVDQKNGMIYIGQHKNMIFDPNYHGSGSEIRKIMKIRPQDLKTYLIQWANDPEELNELERKLIKQYGMGEYGYNKIIIGSYDLSEDRQKKLRKQISKHIKEAIKDHHFYTNGQRNIFINPNKEQIPEGFHKGIHIVKRPDFVSKAKGTKWYNNGKIMKMCKPGTEPEGFVEGQLSKINHNHVGGRKWYHNNQGNARMFIPGTEPEGWKLGIKTDQDHLIRKFYTNGKVNIFLREGEDSSKIPEGFHRGMNSKSTAGMKWYHKGNENRLFVPGTEPEGFIEGGVYKTNNQKVWFNNGKINKMFYKDKVPEGWKLGRIMKHAGKKLLWFHTKDNKNHRAYEGDNIPEDWIPGRVNYQIKKDVSSLKWYHNSKDSAKFIPGTEPEGWIPGRGGNYHRK